jgi:hypothetical protein
MFVDFSKVCEEPGISLENNEHHYIQCICPWVGKQPIMAPLLEYDDAK